MNLDHWELERRPPCWPAGPNPCALTHADHVLRNHVALYGPWKGWRLAGRELVAPSGERLTVERLRGLLWRQDAEDVRNSARARKIARRQIVKVIVVDLADWHSRNVGTRAG